jgi:hypothetical protein
MTTSGHASTIRKLEDLPTDNGRVVDTLAGANLRIFVCLHELEEQLHRLSRRLAVLEGHPETAGNRAERPENLGVG